MEKLHPGDRLKTMMLSAAELLRRFLLHVLPGGFVRTRTAKVTRCRAFLAALPPETPAAPEPAAALMQQLTGLDITRCPVCRAGRLRVVAVFRPGHLPAPALDTS